MGSAAHRMRCREVEELEVRSLRPGLLQKQQLDVERTLENLSPTLFAIRVAKRSLRSGNEQPFTAASAAINDLWDSIAAFQEDIVKVHGAGEEMKVTESLLCTLAETLGELDALQNCGSYSNNTLSEAIAALEASNGTIVACF